MADFWIRHRGEYPKLASVTLPDFNWLGLTSYVIGAIAAYMSPFLPPIVGVFVAAIVYFILLSVPATKSFAAIETQRSN